MENDQIDPLDTNIVREAERLSPNSARDDAIPGVKPEEPTPGEEETDSIDESRNVDSTTSTRLVKFQLFETKSRFYILGSNQNETHNRILKIDRTVEPGELGLSEDEIVYTHKEATKVLNAIDHGNKATGGLQKLLTAWGIIGTRPIDWINSGFIRFTAGYYMSVITKRSPVALLGGHYVYHIDETRLISIASDELRKLDKNQEEARYLSTLDHLDISKTFYFSYSYDITRTLQSNILRQKDLYQKGKWYGSDADVMSYNDMFVWNHFLLQFGEKQPRKMANWCVPIIHGFVDQASILHCYPTDLEISLYGRSIYVCVIARRSRYFAGARFLKRGVNDKGYVANEVETEQIVSELITTSFHAPGGGAYENPHWTSYVQHRGSIPLYWTQDVASMSPKPPIELNVVDPFFSAAALHFNQMFERYGIPCIALSLIKQKERTPRESILGNEYTQAINYLNQFLPAESRIKYIAFDMARASKSRDQEVIERLESIAEDVLSTTGFFHNGSYSDEKMSLQHGICRTNCVDCLDRTNACQFIIAKRALGLQLFALGIIDKPQLAYDTDAVNLLMEMFHDHGDTIALQYGGSHLVNTMETAQWSSHSRDMIESIRRFYSNSFVDAQRQEAINLFLGNYTIAKGQPTLWELTTDYYLHHIDPRFAQEKPRSYVKWWDPKNLENRPPVSPSTSHVVAKNQKTYDILQEEMWQEYYRPFTISSVQKIFSYNMNSTLRNFHPKHDKTTLLSPFRPQNVPIDPSKHLPALQDKKKDETRHRPRMSLYRWLGQHHEEERRVTFKPDEKQEKPPTKEVKDGMEILVQNLLEPKISVDETKEYERYIAHPRALTMTVHEKAHPEYTAYVNDAFENNYIVEENDVKMYETSTSLAEEGMMMRATLVDKDELSRRKAQGFQSWVKGQQRKLERS